MWLIFRQASFVFCRAAFTSVILFGFYHALSLDTLVGVILNERWYGNFYMVLWITYPVLLFLCDICLGHHQFSLFSKILVGVALGLLVNLIAYSTMTYMDRHGPALISAFFENSWRFHLPGLPIVLTIIPTWLFGPLGWSLILWLRGPTNRTKSPSALPHRR